MLVKIPGTNEVVNPAYIIRIRRENVQVPSDSDIPGVYYSLREMTVVIVDWADRVERIRTDASVEEVQAVVNAGLDGISSSAIVLWANRW